MQGIYSENENTRVINMFYESPVIKGVDILRQYAIEVDANKYIFSFILL